MKQNKKRPERTCIVCRNKKEKRDLIRIVRNKDGEIFYDPTGKANGRGAYICNSQSCLDKFLKKASLERAFRTKLDKDKIKKVKEEILSAIDLKNAENEEKNELK